MNRRSLLVVLGTGMVAGCITAPSEETGSVQTDSPLSDTPAIDSQGVCGDDGTWEPTIQTDEVVVAAGEQTTFAIHAGPIASFKFDPDLYRCSQPDAPVQFGDVHINPDPDSQAFSCPPIWTWETCLSITLHVPVEAAADADSGTYEYGFSVSDGGVNPPQEYTSTITVTEG
jgi:hypothetical protein